MYRVEERNEGVLIYGIKDFNLKHIFECGQCFRWNINSDGYYCGVAKGKYIEVLFENSILTIKGATEKDFFDIWYDYFDLRTDYEKIKAELSSIDENIKKAVDFGYGIRLLSQEPFETLISFIISANNNIPRIKGCIENLCRGYGKVLKEDVYAFPTSLALSCVDACDISECTRAGYRCGYISETAKLFNEVSFDRELFSKMTIEEARIFMQQYKGVGAKVADCVLLFTGSYQNAFPVDVWVKKVMNGLYGVETFKQIDLFQKNYFGELSGYAQQYLFYAIREGFLVI